MVACCQSVTMIASVATSACFDHIACFLVIAVMVKVVHKDQCGDRWTGCWLHHDNL